MGTFGITFGGVAVVTCIHDREKRQITTEAEVAELGLLVGQIYDRRQHHLALCTCCENLFVMTDDEPRYCSICSKIPIHAPGGPLAQPKGRISDG